MRFDFCSKKGHSAANRDIIIILLMCHIVVNGSSNLEIHDEGTR